MLGLIAFVPYLANYRLFGGMFWFGDEFPLINEIDTMPFGRWLWYPLVEHVLPLYKLWWGILVIEGGGSFRLMLWVSWTVHGFATALLARWLLRERFSQGSVIFCALVFAWSASQIETLAWSIQISSQLATVFFLCAGLSGPSPVGQFFSCLGSAWSFARGILTGPVMALTLWREARRTRSRFLAAAICAVIPAVATVVLMVKLAPANSAHAANDLGRFARVARFSLCYLAGSPLLPFRYSAADGTPFESGWGTVVWVGMVKLGLMVAGWRAAGPAQRRVLFPLLMLDLGYSMLLGLGRSDGDWHYGMGSRYQYTSLLCSLPFFAAAAEGAFRLPALAGRGAKHAGAGLVILLAGFSFYAWSKATPGWVEWRGLRNRNLLLSGRPVPEGNSVEALPTFPNWRAKQLVEKYHLH